MQTRPKLRLLLAAAAVSIGASVSAAHATPIVPSPTLTVAGNTFSNFTCSLSGNGTPTSCRQINVGADPLNNGIEISSGFTALPGQFTDAVLSYSVAGTTPISGIDLSFNGTFFGLAVSSVTETAIDPTTGDHVGFLQVSCSLLNCTQSDPATGFLSLTGGSYTNLLIEKDINVTAAVGIAQISIIDQSFHNVSVPEPTSLALLGTGFLGLGALSRRTARKGRFV